MTELEILKDRIEQLEGVLGLKIDFHNILGLTPLQSKIAGLLFKRDIVTRDIFLDCLYWDREPDPKVIEVHLVHVRRKLSEHGIAVKNRFGIGWYIPAPDKLKLKNLMEVA